MMVGVGIILRAPLLAIAICTILASTAPTSRDLHDHPALDLDKRQNIGVFPAPGSNNYSCRSAKHPNPVIFLHGLLASENFDTNILQANLSRSGYCTFALTYGELPFLPGFGGLQRIDDSANVIAKFIRDVKTRTGAAKVDIVGHSEGGLMSLYVPKVKNVGPIVDKIVALAPLTHGTTFTVGNYPLDTIAGGLKRIAVGLLLSISGCPACDDFGVGGQAIRRLNDGKPIKQDGNKITVIITRNDQVVIPIDTARLDEPGVRNIYVQDACPRDFVGHIGLAYDTYVWGIVTNALDPTSPLYPCTSGLTV